MTTPPKRGYISRPTLQKSFLPGDIFEMGLETANGDEVASQFGR
jgi:hypothetical protein